MAEQYILSKFAPILTAILAFEPVALFLKVCPSGGLNFISKALQQHGEYPNICFSWYDCTSQ